MRITINIFEMSPGSAATIVGYSKVYGGYVGKLISKGLLPGTQFVILNFTTQGEVQIMLKDQIVMLSKPEVNALCVEILSDEE
ncbi:MAG: FeoA domain-containing protein [Cyanobacteria bacterium P01_G01_bin.39]